MNRKSAWRHKTFAFILIAFLSLAAAHTSFAESFTATSIGDYGNVTVMEVIGNYDANNSDGSVNSVPRQAIAKEFFKTHRDEYDFLVIFTNFDLQMPEDGHAKAFYMGIKNDTQGIGIDPFDMTNSFGSEGKLQGAVDMGNIGKVVSDPLDPKFDETLYTLSHEIMHHWGVHARFRNPDGTGNTALLGRGGSHWSFLFDSGMSVMYGNRWQDNGNGTFTSLLPQSETKLYSPLDLYLMGMIDKSRVSPMLLIDNPTVDPTRLPEAGVTISGTAHTVTIDDIIAAEGPRIPDVASAQKSFKIAFIYITTPGTFNAEEIYQIENIRNGFVTRHSILTDGQSIVEVASTPKEDVPTNPGVLPPSTTPRSVPSDINDGVAWLVGNQLSDGSWIDYSQTPERDTAEAVRLLKNFASAQQSFQSGLAWLAGNVPDNADYLTKKIETLAVAGQDVSALVQNLISLQNSDGGWGKGKNYWSNPTDTALALKALLSVSYTDMQTISKAIGYLKTQQNSVGGWGSEDKGGMVQETSSVLSAFNKYRTAYQLDDIIARGLAWLLTKQNPDSGFGNSPSTVYDTALAILALRELNASSEITNKGLEYLLGRQSENGSWNNSAYQTALAVNAIFKATVDPDLSIKSEDITIIPDKIRSLPSNIVINANISNLGQTSAQAKVVFYEGSISDESKLGEQTLVFPGQSTTAVTFSAIAKDGNEHRFYIVVDPDNQVKESNELNNSAVKILYPEATYDFEILSSDVAVSADPVNILQDVTISAKITNKGTMNAYNVQVKYYIDDPVSPFEIATKTVDIPAGATVTNQTIWRASKAGANLALMIFVDPFENFAELSETNNKASAALTVNSDTRQNLILSYTDLVITPSPANQSGTANISALVKNEGFSAANNIVVHFYRGVPGPDGLLLGTQTIPMLNANENTRVALDWTNIPETGEKIIYVQVDPENAIPEIREDDNDAFTTLSILTLPDFAVAANSITFSPAAPKDGDPVTITVTVQNKGEQAASNVVVRLSESGSVIGDLIISSLAGISTGTVSLPYDTAGRKGAHAITATIDPDNTIAEQSEDNNSASRTLGVQDANMWVTEQYISPNGDGVKDSTELFFRLQAAATVSVRVLNRKNEALRTFTGPELVNTMGGSVTWDGLNASGVVVDDGEYQLQILDDAGNVFAMLQVVVDNNKSPLTDALGTKHLLNSNLTCMLPDIYDEDWVWLADESGIILSLRGADPDFPQYEAGIYYISPAGDVENIVPAMLAEDDFVDPSTWNLSKDGKIAFLSWKYNTEQRSYTEELWTIDVDGRNLRLLMQYEQAGSSLIHSVKWAPNGKYILYNFGIVYDSEGNSAYELWVLDAETLVKTRVDWGYLTTGLSAEWSPDSNEIAYLVRSFKNGGEELRVSDMSGNKKTIYSFYGDTWYTPIHWLDDKKLIVEHPYIRPELWLFDASGNGNHIKLSDDHSGEISISPDGKSVAFITSSSNVQLNLSDTAGHSDIIHELKSTGLYCVPRIGDAVWSTDSKRILFSTRVDTCGDCPVSCDDPYEPQIISFDLQTREKTSFEGSFSGVRPIKWLSDNVSIISSNYNNIYLFNLLTGQGNTLISDIELPWPLHRSVSPLQNYLTYYKLVDESSACYDTSYRDLWVATSLLNLTADLQAIKNRSSVILKGIAADLNFESYQLEYADTKNYAVWNPIAPASNVPVVNDVFTTWIPPYEGTFYVRLTVRDKAGNTAMSRKRVSWGTSSGITNLYKSLDMFSPNNDGVKDTVELHYRVLEPLHLEFTIYDYANNPVKTYYRDHAAPAGDYISWDGTDASLNVVPDGKYKIKVFDYEFFVEVDNTSPDVNIFLDQLGIEEGGCECQTGCTKAIPLPDPYTDNRVFTHISGRAFDKNIKKWTIEYGEGDNPQEWSEFIWGNDALLATDEERRPILNTDTKIQKIMQGNLSYPCVLFKAETVENFTGKKFRITTEDHAGNRSTRISDFIEEKIQLYGWSEQRDIDTITGDQSMPVKLYLSGLNTLLIPLESMSLQYSGNYPAMNASWVEAESLPLSRSINVEWDNSGLKLNGAYAVRIKAVDIEGNEHYSNIVSLGRSFRLGIGCNQLIGAENTASEQFDTLRFQVRSSQDPRFNDWTDFLSVKPAVYGTLNYLNLNVHLQKLIGQKIPGVTHELRMIGTNSAGGILQEYPAPGSPPVEYPKKDCARAVIELKVNYGEGECGQLAPGKATLQAELKQLEGDIEFVGLSYFMDTAQGAQLLRRFDLTREAWGTTVVDTTVMQEGLYPVRAVLEYMNKINKDALTASATHDLIVDRVLPSSQLTYPAGNSLQLCPLPIHDVKTGDWYGIPVEAVSDDNTSVQQSRLYYGDGQNPGEWLPATYPEINSRGELVQTQIVRSGADKGRIGTWDVSNLARGTYSFNLKVIDKAGNASCATSSFSIDTSTEINQLAVDKTLFSPNNDDVLDVISTNYSIAESAVVDVKIFKVTQNHVLDSAAIRTIESGRQHIGGTDSIIWDGKNDSGSIVPDDKYGIAVFAADSCGNPANRWVEVEVDNTKPSAVIAYPKPGDALGNTVEVKGTVDDLHFQSYTLEAGEGDPPATWSLLASNNYPVSNGVLGAWNTYGLAGTWTLRLTATDKAGNRSETMVTIDLGARQDLVKALEAAPKLFSPNNDANIDGAVINYETTDTCDVKIDILDAAGSVRKNYSAPALSAGLHSYTWNGTDNANSVVADGSYTVRLSAALSSNTAVSQAETVTVVVDTTLPVIDISQPLNGSYLTAQGFAVTGSISDLNMSEYSLAYTGASGAALIDQANQSRTSYSFGALNALPEGDYSLEAKAEDLGQNETIRNIAFTIDRTPPVVTLETPKDGEYYGAEKNIVNITGSIAEKNLELFNLRYGAGDNPAQWTDLVSGSTVTAYPRQYAWKVGKDDGIPDGVYTLSLFAKDKAGLTGETKAKVIIDNTLPVAAITSLHDGEYVKQAVDVKGSAFDQNLDKYTLEISEDQCVSAFKWASIKTATTSLQDGTLATWQTPPTDGDYCVRLTAVDKVGQTSEAKVIVKVDTHPPGAPALSGRVDDRTNANLDWTGNTEPDIAGYNVYQGGRKINAELVAGPEFRDQNLAEGIYEYIVKAVDLAGWESEASNAVRIKIDLTGPTARIRSPQDAAWISDVIDIKGTVYSEDDFKQYRIYIGQGASPVAWNLVRTSPLPVSYGVLTQWDTSGLSEGVYSVKLEAEDASGNITTHQVQVTLDNTAPARPVIVSSAANNADVTTTWNANTEPDLAGYLLYRNDQLANVAGIVVGDLKPYLISAASYLDKALPDGLFKYYVIAMDQAGNMSEPSDIREVTIDTHAPHAVIVDPADQTAFGGKILIKAESPDLDIAKVQFEYKKDSDSSWQSLGAPVTSQPYATYLEPEGLGLVYGNYQLRAVAADKGLGGQPHTDNAPAAITLTYADLTLPPAPTGLSAKTTGADVSLAWTASADADTVSYNVYRSGGTARTRINQTALQKQTVSYTDTGLSDGVYAYDVTAVDANNNESKPSAPASAKVYAPVITQPATPTAQQTIRVVGSNAAADSALEIFVEDDAGSGSRGSATAGQAGGFSFDVALTPGENRITVKATDGKGNVSKASGAAVVVYDQVPAAPAGLAASVNGSNVSLAWNENAEPDLAGYQVYRNAGQGWVKLTGTAIQSLAYDDSNLPNGTYSYYVTAQDLIDSESQPSNEASVTLSLDPPQPPVILNVTAMPTGELGVTWEHTGTAVVGYNIYRSTTPGGPYGKVNGAPVAGTTHSDAGLVNGSSYYYVVTAVDQAGNESVYSNEGSGIPADTVAPGKPRITAPAVPGSPIAVPAARTDVSGTADPATTVELFKNGVSAGTTTTTPGVTVRSFALDPAIGESSLSPDGSMLAYQANGSIWLKELASETVSEIVPGGDSPLWSPDGTRIAYRYSDSNWNYRIGIFDRATGSSTPLTEDLSVYEYSPSWSSDGTKIAFAADRSGINSVWLKDMTTGGLLQVMQSDYVYNQQLSPDGSKLAYFENGSLNIKDLASGQTALVDDNTDWYSITWSPDSRSAAFVSYRTGEAGIYIVELATGSQVPIIDVPGDVYWPIWSLDGRDIIFAAWDEQTASDSLWSAPALRQGAARLIEQGLPGLYYLTAIDNGGVAYVNVDWDADGNPVTANLKIKSSGGTFEFKNISLDQGENVFAARAIDGAGNVSPLSDAITVVFDAGELPELSVSAEDVYLYPSAPIAGERMSINAVISNTGGRDATDVDAAVYAWNALGQMELLTSGRIPLLAAGSASLVTAEWDSTGKAGDNRIVIVVDSEYRIDESLESNNMTIKDFFAADRAGVSMTTATDNPEYSSNQPVKAAVTVRNAGPMMNGVLEARIEDENGYPAASFDPKAVTLSYASAVTESFIWNTGTIYAGSYFVRMTLKDASGVLAENTTAFTIVPDATAALDLVTDKIAYGPQENVVMNYSVRNSGANSIIPALRAFVSITDGIGTALFSEAKTASNLLPGASVDLSSLWNAGLNSPGDYNATVEVSFGGGATITKAATFKISSSLVITGTVSVSPPVVAVGNSAQIVYSMANTGNVDAFGAAARISLIDPETQDVKQIFEESVELGKNTSKTGQIMVSTDGYELKTYTAVLQSINQEVTKNIAVSSFTVKDLTPPKVTIASPVENTTYRSAVTISVSAADNASGVDRVEYRIDGGAWKLMPVADPVQGRYAAIWEPAFADSGGHTISFRASDKAGNTSMPVPVNITIQMDTEPPILTLSTLPDGSITNNETLNIAGTVTDNIAVQEVTVNDTAVTVNPDGSFSQAVKLTAGTNTLTTTATDTAGNTAADTRTITLDQSAPVITITEPADNSLTNNENVIVTGTIDKTSTVSIKVNGNATLPEVVTDSTFTFQVMLVYGQNTIEVTAVDLATNSSTDKRTVTLDNLSPALAVISPAQDISTNQFGILLQGTVSDLTGITVTITMDETEYSPVVTNGTFQQQVNFVEEKQYGVTVTAADAAGNTSTVQRNIIFDKTPPGLTIDPVNTPTNSSMQQVTGTMEPESTVAVLCTTAMAGEVSYPTTTTWQVVIADMTEGENIVSATATDRTGNVSNPVNAAILLDTHAPVTTTSPVPGVYAAVLAVTLTANEQAKIHYTTDGTIPSTDSLLYNGPVTITVSSTIKFFAVDQAGNSEALKQAVYTINYDTMPPATTISVGDPRFTSNDGKLYVTKRTPLTLSAADNMSGVAKTEYRVDQGQWKVYTEAFTAAAYGDGEHIVFYGSTDNAGHAEEPKELKIALDSMPPDTAISASDPLVNGQVNTVSPSTLFFLSALDNLSGVSATQYRIDGGDWRNYIGGFSLAGLSAGQHTISYKSRDNVLNEETEQTLTVRLIILDVTKKVTSDAVVLFGVRPGQTDHDKHDDHDDREDCDDNDNDEDTRHVSRRAQEKGNEENRIDDDHEVSNGDRHNNSEAGQAALHKLEDILAAAGISYHISEDRADFKEKFRSGRFNTYLLLGLEGDNPLDHDLDQEMREAINYGAGLIVIKSKPDEEPRLGDVLGVDFSGKTTEKDVAVTLIDSPISNGGILQTTGKALRAAVVSPAAQSFGFITDKHTTWPAIIFNQYQSGRTMLFTFDVLSMQDEAQAAALIINSIHHVRPTGQKPFALAGMPIRITVSAAEPADIRVKEYLPRGTTAAALNPDAEIIEDAIKWDKTVQAMETAGFEYRLNLPDLTADYTAMTEISYFNSGEYRFYGMYNLDLTVQYNSKELLVSVIKDLDAVLTTLMNTDKNRDRADWLKSHDVGYLEAAIGHLQKVDGNYEAEQNIKRIIDAIVQICRVSVDVTAVRLKLDELLKIWEMKWYLRKNK